MAQNQKWGTDTYSKWDNMEDLEMTSDEKQSIVPTNFSLGPNMEPPVPASSPPLQNHFMASDIKKLSKLEQTNAVWAFDVLKLRMFSSSGRVSPVTNKPYPCRPACMVLSALYPIGRMMDYRLTKNSMEPHKDPTIEEILDIIKQVSCF